MRLTLVLTTILTCLALSGSAQTDSSYRRITRTNLEYKDALYDEGKLYALSTTGQVVIWDLAAMDTIGFPIVDTAKYWFRCVAKDRNGDICFGTYEGHIYKYNRSTGECELAMKLEEHVHYLFYNSDNKPIVITGKGVYDPISKKTWSKFGNHPLPAYRLKKKWFSRRYYLGKKVYQFFSYPEYVFMDSQDRLWMTANKGEWGGDLQIFDAKNYCIHNNDLAGIQTSLLSPNSVLEDSKGDIYINSGSQHMSNHGQILRVKDNCAVDTAYKCEYMIPSNVIKKPKVPILAYEVGVFIGPGAYNSQDTSIYFASNFGILKVKADKGTTENASLVYNSELGWVENRDPNYLVMNIKRMEFLPDGRLLFITQKDGLGIIDGGKITLLK